MRQRLKRAGVYLGVLLFGVAVSLTPTDTPTVDAQSPVAADAIEYGISLGLPPAWAYRVACCESRWQPGRVQPLERGQRALPVPAPHLGRHAPGPGRAVPLRPLRQRRRRRLALPRTEDQGTGACR